jgi:hypothetical protein
MERRERGFIGWIRCSNYCQETDEINRSNGDGFGSNSGSDFGWRWVMTGGSHLSVSGGEEKHTGSVEGFLGRGLVAVLGRKGFPGSSFTFLFLFLFSFSVFYFLCIFCKNASNQFKPLS